MRGILTVLLVNSLVAIMPPPLKKDWMEIKEGFGAGNNLWCFLYLVSIMNTKLTDSEFKAGCRGIIKLSRGGK